MLVKIDTTAADPIYSQIAREIRAAIASGAIPEGARLPAARDLAKSLDVNMHTVLRSYSELRDSGDIELRRGRGAVVLPRADRDPKVTAAITKLLELARERGVTVAELHEVLDDGASR